MADKKAAELREKMKEKVRALRLTICASSRTVPDRGSGALRKSQCPERRNLRRHRRPHNASLAGGQGAGGAGGRAGGEECRCQGPARGPSARYAREGRVVHPNPDPLGNRARATNRLPGLRSGHAHQARHAAEPRRWQHSRSVCAPCVRRALMHHRTATPSSVSRHPAGATPSSATPSSGKPATPAAAATPGTGTPCTTSLLRAGAHPPRSTHCTPDKRVCARTEHRDAVPPGHGSFGHAHPPQPRPGPHQGRVGAPQARPFVQEGRHRHAPQGLHQPARHCAQGQRPQVLHACVLRRGDSAAARRWRRRTRCF